MPVKVKCPECNKVLNAPDAARGKAVKCPDCSARVPVPAGEAAGKAASKPASGKAAPAAKAAKAAPAKKKSEDEDDDFLARLDLKRMEDRNTRVCPKCGAVIDDEDTECASCGIDLRTGELGKTAKKARMKGPDPADFYGMVWSDSWNFMVENFNLVISAFSNLSYALVVIWILGYLSWLGAVNDHIPSWVFFFSVSCLFCLAYPGWFLYLSSKVISFTLEKKVKLDRTPFEMFTGMATGIGWIVWAAVTALPTAAISAPVYFMMKDSDPTVMGVIIGSVTAVWVLPLIPVAMAHRAMPVQWKLWSSPLLWKATIVNIAPALYTLLVALILALPALLLNVGAIAITVFFFQPMLDLFGLKYGEWNQYAWLSFAVCYGIPTGALQSGSSMTGVTAGLIITGFVILKAGVVFLTACSGMMIVRVVSQFVNHFRKWLELIGQVKEIKYVAKKIEYGPDGEPIKKKAHPAVVAISLVLGFALGYVAVDMIIFLVSEGKNHSLPLEFYQAIRMANPENRQ